LFQAIDVDAVALDAQAIVGILDGVVGVAHPTVRLHDPSAVGIVVVGVGDLLERVLPLVRTDLFV